MQKQKARLLKKNMKKPTSQTKSKGQKRKQQTSLCDQSTDEESVVSVHLDDDTDDSLHIGDDELTEPLALGTLSIGDYVLVEFEGKNSSLHYVGFVKEKDNSEVFVSFLRRKDSDSSKFFFPQVVDESYVNLADVKMKLPIPSRSGVTAHVAEMIEFSDVDFFTFSKSPLKSEVAELNHLCLCIKSDVENFLPTVINDVILLLWLIFTNNKRRHK
ncbi:hypothetical protein QYM36_000459 [Artemia franciscana]|uniref:Uncharacterized protein n=1 Tax=Artemia franciscana TaxID=6661 RepID=A0AA88ICV6_ARTSF|nr:hypothetical protein QYM36_000459 [Artemia franciscana]